ncbi:MAG TPA: bifunctional diaminohydroxyphosphoribosylaminopyrimidine deaminase/5-amino-6-(5-phosphoribosylamino)uracil reductase RibD [Aquiluna sp.]
MSRALELALNGPAIGVNPQVGAVILDSQGQIVSEGWHQGAGTDHAEMMALKNLFAKTGSETLAPGHTAVVTLEPCNHQGRTGPCAQALIDAGISRVVYASSDPGDISGKGSERLKNAGVEVVSGVLLSQAEDQGRVWLTANRNQRPYVILKWASSLDGRTAAQDGTSQWISGPESRADSHLKRSQVEAILVGTGTVLADNPELTARKSDGSYYEDQPLRVVLGKRELPGHLKVFNEKAKTIHIERHNPAKALAELWAIGVKSVWVEGGPKVASEFVKAGLVDEIIVYLAPMLLGGNNVSLQDIGVETMSQAIGLELVENKMLGRDIYLRLRRA